jgi:hypothetical protein
VLRPPVRGLDRALALDADALDGDLGAVLLEGHRGQLHLDPLAQAGRRRVSPAAAADQRLELLLDPEFPQARRAVLEVLGDQRAALITGLVVEELEYVGERRCS